MTRTIRFIGLLLLNAST
ncbi:leu operon leader peptide, partial [Klebsiella variicola]